MCGGNYTGKTKYNTQKKVRIGIQINCESEEIRSSLFFLMSTAIKDDPRPRQRCRVSCRSFPSNMAKSSCLSVHLNSAYFVLLKKLEQFSKQRYK
jgi:hypothetical protein